MIYFLRTFFSGIHFLGTFFFQDVFSRHSVLLRRARRTKIDRNFRTEIVFRQNSRVFPVVVNARRARDRSPKPHWFSLVAANPVERLLAVSARYYRRDTIAVENPSTAGPGVRLSATVRTTRLQAGRWTRKCTGNSANTTLWREICIVDTFAAVLRKSSTCGLVPLYIIRIRTRTYAYIKRRKCTWP